MNRLALRIACWRDSTAADGRRLAAAVRLAQLFPGTVALVFAGASVDATFRRQALAAGIAIEETDLPREIDLVLALDASEPGLTLPAPAVARLSPGENAPAGVLGITGEDDAELGEALAFLALDPDLRRGLRRERQADFPAGIWLVDGPFDSSFSLALVNRELATALAGLGLPAAVDGPPQREGTPPNAEFLRNHPSIADLYKRRGDALAVALGNDYPPFAAALPRAPLTLLGNYAWEESGYPLGWVREFNWRLDALTVCSPLTKKILREAGVRRPIAVVGNGIDHLQATAPQAPEGVSLGAPGRFRFLHISSCLPRKGIDVLLEAYGQAFSAADPVTLVIKSTPSDANVAPSYLARCRAARPDFPEVVLIDADWPESAIAWLYSQCDVFVLTPRAEGFGLPIAEAAQFGLPPITSAVGGQRCLVDETTAFLVPGRFAPACSHLGIPDSLWFEPDVAALAQTLRQVFSLPRDELRRRAYRLHERLLANFRWAQVAERSRRVVSTVWQSPSLCRQPKVAWISTWNTRCGLATYSAHLTARWPAERLLILANSDAEPLAPEAAKEPEVQRCWSRADFPVERLATMIRTAGCAAVVAQHHPGLYPIAKLAALARLLSSDGILCSATLHNTAFLDEETATSLGALHRLYVHTVDDVNRLARFGLADKTCLFPHGVYPPPPEGGNLLDEIGLAGKRVIATFGFLMPHKGLEQVLEAFAMIAGSDSTLHLLMLNAIHPTAASIAEAERIQELIRKRRLQQQVSLLTEFLPDQTALALLASAEVAVFAYQHTDESASGAVRMAIAAGCPCLTTPLPIFADVAEAVDFLSDGSATAIATALRELLARFTSPSERRRARERVAHFAARRQWPLLGERLLNMIDGDINDPFPDGLLPLAEATPRFPLAAGG